MLDELETLMSMQGSFKQYRLTLSQTTAPAIPYIGVILQDLTFVDENPDKFGKLINFEKQRMVYNMISDVLRFQHTPYNFNFQALDKDQTLESLEQGLSEKDLYDYSLQREPRNAGRSDVI